MGSVSLVVLRVYIFMVICLLFSPKSIAQQIITIVVNPIPNLLNNDSQQLAPYNRFLNRFSNIEIVFVPATRMLGQFFQSDVSCLFPGSKNTMPGKETLIQSKPLKIAKAYLFTAKSNSLEQSPKALIALRRGYIYGGVRQKVNADFVELSTAKETLKSLTLSRVDAVIGYLPEIRAAAIEEKIDMPFYDESDPIYESSHRFVCHDTAENRQFILKANKQISAFLLQTDLP